MMSSSSLSAVREDARMNRSGPRAGGPTSRRSFTSAQKLDHVAAYEVAVANGQGGGYLRTKGWYSSLISEWRRLRDAGVLAGKKPGEKIGRLTKDQIELARVQRRLTATEQRLRIWEVALAVMGKHTSSWKNCPRARGTPLPVARPAHLPGVRHRRPRRHRPAQHPHHHPRAAKRRPPDPARRTSPRTRRRPGRQLRAHDPDQLHRRHRLTGHVHQTRRARQPLKPPR